MTTPNQPEEPWLLEPTVQLPVQAPAKRRPNIVLLALIIMVVLCCGGFGLVASAIRGGGSSRPEAEPSLVVPSPAESSTGEPSPSAHPTTTPKPSASTKLVVTVKPTTSKPKPTTARPTTTKPATPTPSATTPGIQQGVRAGEPCSPAGAFGMTTRGRLLRCGPSATDPRNRWRPLVS